MLTLLWRRWVELLSSILNRPSHVFKALTDAVAYA
jgi:hypothetical protein